MYESHTRIRNMIIICLFAGMIAIFAQLTISLPFVPITGQTLAIGLAATVLGSKKGMYAVTLYCILGAIGLPVFSEMKGGLNTVVGPTGGYIIGFIPTAFLIGLILEKVGFTVTKAMIANTVGMFVTLIFGTVWLKYSSFFSWQTAFLVGFLPFIVVGLLKAYLASILGIALRKRLQLAGLEVL